MNANELAETVINRIELRIESLSDRTEQLDEKVPSLSATKMHIHGKQDGLREAIAFIKEELY